MATLDAESLDAESRSTCIVFTYYKCLYCSYNCIVFTHYNVYSYASFGQIKIVLAQALTCILIFNYHTNKDRETERERERDQGLSMTSRRPAHKVCTTRCVTQLLHCLVGDSPVHLNDTLLHLRNTPLHKCTLPATLLLCH